MKKDYSFTGYNPKQIETARRLRREMTPQERKLWHCFLKAYPMKFYRQRSIDRFVVDFYCASARLVIELDGSQHYTDEGKAYDLERTAVLRAYGLEVPRFYNYDVDNHFQAVCEEIDRKAKKLRK